MGRLRISHAPGDGRRVRNRTGPLVRSLLKGVEAENDRNRPRREETVAWIPAPSCKLRLVLNIGIVLPVPPGDDI